MTKQWKEGRDAYGLEVDGRRDIGDMPIGFRQVEGRSEHSPCAVQWISLLGLL